MPSSHLPTAWDLCIAVVTWFTRKLFSHLNVMMWDGLSGFGEGKIIKTIMNYTTWCIMLCCYKYFLYHFVFILFHLFFFGGWGVAGKKNGYEIVLSFYIHQDHYKYLSTETDLIQHQQMKELGPGQPGRMRWIFLWTMPLAQDPSLDLLASSPAHYNCTTDTPLTSTTSFYQFKFISTSASSFWFTIY